MKQILFVCGLLFAQLGFGMSHLQRAKQVIDQYNCIAIGAHGCLEYDECCETIHFMLDEIAHEAQCNSTCSTNILIRQLCKLAQRIDNHLINAHMGIEVCDLAECSLLLQCIPEE